ncbi:hypothetical protein EDC19_1152 [Natranaerovirga hydrolytica]|uniref:Uncharacterized protein n=1 Tax=Natranaerovirga hydrolytica TaxID=680378 RepID=A0A4R1MZF4_9FIRM|nr:hypothetical protein [Natranaerovirga hydrolytica]TCK98718.1 hypothetical protein EDC19_1152 [Natranaerovirga hydrolytica]
MICNNNKTNKTTVSKYQSYQYWEHLIHNNKPMWKDGFLGESLNEDSIFVYTVIVDYNKDFLKNQWGYYSNVYALLGFLQYVFLPTSFFTWLDDAVEGFNIPIATGEEMLQMMCEIENTINIQDITFMKKQLEEIKTYWQLSEEDCLKKIIDLAEAYNNKWNNKTDKQIYFKVLKSSKEVSDYVLSGGAIEEEAFVEVVEAEMEMSKKEWHDMCKNVYHNKFLQKRFLDTLNNKIGCLI